MKSYRIEYSGANPHSIADARASYSTSLARVRRDGGEEVALKLLSSLIIEASLFFNVTHQITPHQIAQTAELILKRYFFLNMADIKLCFEMGKSGDFGKIYDRMDGGIIMNWFSEYNAQRMAL